MTSFKTWKFAWFTCFLLLQVALVTFTSCEDIVLYIQRSTIGEGFHRNIETKVMLQGDEIVFAPQNLCSVLLIEMLPAGLYVNIYELNSMAQFGGPQVLTDKHVDMEAPEYLSENHKLYVYTAVPLTNLSTEPFSVNVMLPVHIRYHQPSSDPEITSLSLEMQHPRVLLNCSRKNSRLTKAPCDVHNTSVCSWTEVTYKTDSQLLEFSVPVGVEGDVRLVVFGTLVVTVIGCTFLLYMIAFYDQWTMKVKRP